MRTGQNEVLVLLQRTLRELLRKLLQRLLHLFGRAFLPSARQEVDVLPPRHLLRIEKRRRRERSVRLTDVLELQVGVGRVHRVDDL